MIIRAVKVRIATKQGEFGISAEFARNLTIVKGNNSAGKSTLFNSLLYGLGMEELIGGRGEKVLPYAVKDWFDYQGKKVEILASEVYLEIENRRSEAITLRRAIKDEVKSSKLIEVIEGGVLTGRAPIVVRNATYLHDPGSAQKEEGFYRFLETFLGLQLPTVPMTTGGETKLYLQAVFAALVVEQKRGWSDYIANIPFFGIKDAKVRVVEYLLGLGVFESRALRNRLDTESVEIANGWNSVHREVERITRETGTTINGLPIKVSATFDPSTVKLLKRDVNGEVEIYEYLNKLRTEYAGLEKAASEFKSVTSEELRAEFDKAMSELNRFSHLYETVKNSQSLRKASLQDYEKLLAEANEDLAKNKAVLKLRELGAGNSIEVAVDRCPTCHQPIQDSLLDGIATGPQMDLATNVNYLERQSKMLESQIGGLRIEISSDDASLLDLASRMNQKREQLNALRVDVSTGALQSRANIKRQMQIDDEAAKLARAESEMAELLKQLSEYAQNLLNNQTSRKGLPSVNYSNGDVAKIGLFEKLFRANAGAFGYESADIAEININYETLTPFLSDIELRQYRNSIRSDSSASDFVRLIWSYLLGLYQASSHPACKGNHPAILLFDEPGQHSMAESSQRALLQQLSSEKNLQSIVAASFDESDAVFRATTTGVEFKLIEWDGKSIQPLH